MARRRVWTKPQDDMVRTLRAAGCAWDQIAGAVGVSRNAVIERGRALHARLPPRLSTVVRIIEDVDRPALPPGDARCWGALVTGTSLEGMKYPRPGPIGRERRGVIGELC